MAELLPWSKKARGLKNTFFGPHSIPRRVRDPAGKRETWGRGGERGLKHGPQAMYILKSFTAEQLFNNHLKAFAASLPLESRAQQSGSCFCLGGWIEHHWRLCMFEAQGRGRFWPELSKPTMTRLASSLSLSQAVREITSTLEKLMGNIIDFSVMIFQYWFFSTKNYWDVLLLSLSLVTMYSSWGWTFCKKNLPYHYFLCQ